jgi:hypothetical protein
MTAQRRVQILAIASLMFGLSPNVLAQSGSPTPALPEGVRSATVIVVHGKITAVDKAAKQVTVEEPDGRKVPLRVENPYNLENTKEGEAVVARIYEVVSVRKKRPDESLPSVSVKGGIVTAKPGEVPGATASQHMSVVFSVAAIDAANGMVTIKGPDGSVETVKARDPKNLSGLSVGDELVVTSSRAFAISLENEPGN